MILPSSSQEQDVTIKTEYEELRMELVESIKTIGGAKAYASFLNTVQERSIDEHTQAHIFGEALYKIEGLDGVAVCDPSLRFGCYHSFFGQAIYEKGIEILPELDALCRKSYGVDTKCQHGLGHGLLVYTGYEDLLKALELCESITDEQTGGCLGGVFMEYNFHTMEQVDNGVYYRLLGENPNEPCDALPERFHSACYLEQVQWWKTVYDNDFVHIGTLCNTLNKESGAYSSCFRGIGNHYSETVSYDFDKIHSLCMQMPAEDATEYCHEGVTWLIVGMDEHKELYDALCPLLQGDARTLCLERWETVEVF
jgi:hypothetical protein